MKSICLTDSFCAETAVDCHSRSVVETPRTRRLLSELKTVVALSDTFDLHKARQIAALALEDDEDFDLRITELVKDQQARLPDQAIRLIRVLEQVCQKPRLLELLLKLTSLGGRVSAKVTLTIGRLVQNRVWLNEQLNDKNDRIRANAVEALWSVFVEEAESVFFRALDDGNNRVVANAALGLYKLRHYQSITVLYELMDHDEELFRRSALWAIGNTNDTRFLPALRSALQDERRTNGERGFAREAIRRLEKVQAAADFTSKIHLEIVRHRVGRDGVAIASLTCSSLTDNVWYGSSELSRVDFAIMENDRQVTEFDLRYAESRGTLSIITVVPSSWSAQPRRLQSLAPKLTAKEYAATLTYPPTLVESLSQDAFCPPDDDEISSAALTPDGTLQAASSLSHAILLGLRMLDGRGGPKHLFVIVDPTCSGGIWNGLILIAQEAAVRVHIIIAKGATDAAVRDFRIIAAGTGGRFTVAASARAIFHQILLLRSAHFATLDLTWQSKSKQPQPISVRYVGPLGSGETTSQPDLRA